MIDVKIYLSLPNSIYNYLYLCTNRTDAEGRLYNHVFGRVLRQSQFKYSPSLSVSTLIDSLCGATGSHVWQKRDVRFRPVAFLWLARGFENSIFLLEKKQEAGRESYLGVPTNF